MRRLSVTLQDDLDAALEEYRWAQPAAPSVAAVIQAALARYLRSATDEVPTEDRSAQPSINEILRRRAEIVEIARQHGATEVRLFGSLARGDATPGSDVDLLVRFEAGRTLVDLARLRSELEDILGVPVDVVSEAGLVGEARDHILSEALAL